MASARHPPLGHLAEAFAHHLLANRYLGPEAPAAGLSLKELANVFERAFKPEYELEHGSMDTELIPGPTASEVLVHMRTEGWVSLSGSRVTGLPRHRAHCPAPSRDGLAGSLASSDDALLRRIRKTAHSPLHLLCVAAEPTFPALLARVGQLAPSIVILTTSSPLPDTVTAWPGYSHTVCPTQCVVAWHHAKLAVEQVPDPGPVLWLLVTQPGRSILLGCGTAQCAEGGPGPGLSESLARVRALHPAAALLLAGPHWALGPGLHSYTGGAILSSLGPGDIQTGPAEGPGLACLVARVANTYCTVCGVGLSSAAEYRVHTDSRQHKKNRVFQFYQNDRENLLRNPHPLGLELRVTEQEQGVVHSVEQGLVTITAAPGQARAFQLELANTRQQDGAGDVAAGRQVGVVVEHTGLARQGENFQLEDKHGNSREERPQKIRLPYGKKYKIRVRAVSSQVGHYRVPLIVAFYHDTASQQVQRTVCDCTGTKRHSDPVDCPVRYIMAHQGLELLLRVQTQEMASLAPSRPFSRPSRLQNWVTQGGPGLVRVTVPAELQQDRAGDKLRKQLQLEHFLLPKALRRMLATNFTKAETEEEREQVERCRRLLELGVVRTGYKERWSLLLHAEEHQLETDIHHYDMGGATLRQLPSKTRFELRVPGLQENRPSVMRGDKICVRAGAAGTYEGHVNEIKEDKVELLFHEKFISRFVKGMKFDVRFTISRFPMRNMHRAVTLAGDPDRPLLDFLFPVASQLVPASAALPSIRCKNRKIEDNAEQLRAVQHIVAGSSGTAPYLVFGPPGTGKTVTVVEAIKQVYELQPEARIVATAPSNAAADLLAERLRTHIQRRHLLRLHAPSRALATIPPDLLPVSNVEQGRYVYPSVEELSQYRVLVVTLVSAGRLVSATFPPGHFTHLFIDEAGQATEPELAIPLRLVAGGGRLVLVGDPRQLGPVIRSPLGSRHGLATSLLERLMEQQPVYARGEEGYDPRCITKLVRNFRSHGALLEVPASLYYHGELLPCADQVMVNSCLQFPGLPDKARGRVPLIFRGIIGQDLKEETSPSFFNPEEAVTVLDYIREITDMRENRVLPKEIGVITPYRRQVQKIRKKLKEHNFDEVTVGSTEEFQGQERKVIIVSTVRSTPEYVHTDSQYRLGFLANPKRFNVAITRAKALLIIVGNPHILSQDPAWAALLAFAVERGCYTGCPYHQETDESIDRLEATFKKLMLKGREEDEITLLTQLEEPAWRTDF